MTSWDIVAEAVLFRGKIGFSMKWSAGVRVDNSRVLDWERRAAFGADFDA